MSVHLTGHYDSANALDLASLFQVRHLPLLFSPFTDFLQTFRHRGLPRRSPRSCIDLFKRHLPPGVLAEANLVPKMWF